MIIALDFDGTVVSHAFPGVGDVLPGCIGVLDDLTHDGHDLILWTLRHGDRLDDAIRWFDDHGIPLYAVNHNPRQDHDSPKVQADLFIDDLSLGCPLAYTHDRPVVCWQGVRTLLEQQGILAPRDNARTPEQAPAAPADAFAPRTGRRRAEPPAPVYRGPVSAPRAPSPAEDSPNSTTRNH